MRFNTRLASAVVLFLAAIALLPAQEPGSTPISIRTERGREQLYEHSYALVIANSNYTDGWSDLPGASVDPDHVRGALERHGFEVISVSNLTADRLYRAIETFIEPLLKSEWVV